MESIGVVCVDLFVDVHVCLKLAVARACLRRSVCSLVGGVGVKVVVNELLMFAFLAVCWFSSLSAISSSDSSSKITTLDFDSSRFRFGVVAIVFVGFEDFFWDCDFDLFVYLLLLGLLLVVAFVFLLLEEDLAICIGSSLSRSLISTPSSSSR